MQATDNKLLVLPPEIRALIHKSLNEGDARNLSATQHFEKKRRSLMPPRERHCPNEIATIGASDPSPLSNQMRITPLFRNMQYFGQTGLVKGLLLQALEVNFIAFNLNWSNLQTVIRIAEAALVCVLQNVTRVTVFIRSQGSQSIVMDIKAVVWIVQMMNTKPGQKPTLHFAPNVPHDYFVYTLDSQYGRALNLPTYCNIHLTGEVPGIFQDWSDRSIQAEA